MSDTILEFYKNQKMSVGDIAELLHLPYGVVKQYLEVRGVEVGRKALSEEEILKKKPPRKDMLRFLIDHGWSVTALANEHNVPWKAAKLWMDKEGVPERPLRKMEREQFTQAMERWTEFIMQVNSELENKSEEMGHNA